MTKSIPIKVVTTKKAAELLKCSLPTFYRKYKPQLTEINTGSRKILYELDAVEQLAIKTFGVVPDYEVIG